MKSRGVDYNDIVWLMSHAAEPAIPPPDAVRCLKSDGLRSVWLVRDQRDQARLLKTWPLSPWFAVKLALGIAQPQRQLRGGRRLRKAGLQSPSVYKCQLRLRPPMRVEVELAYVEGRSLWDICCENYHAWLAAPQQAEALAARLGLIVAQLDQTGLFHRDLKIENIIAQDDDLQQLWLIDPVGVRRMRKRAEEVARMLERLAVQPLAQGMHLPVPVLRAAIAEATSHMTRSKRKRVMQALRSLAEKSHRRESNS